MPADVVCAVRAGIGDEPVERSLEEGRAMTPDEAAEYTRNDD